MERRPRGLRGGFGLWVVVASLGLPALAEAQSGSGFFPLPPCRVYDSRWGAGALAGGFDRWIPVGGICGIPPDATAGAFNFTAIAPSGNALLSAYPCCALRSNVVVGVKAGKSQAGFGVIGLDPSGRLAAYLDAPFSSTADLVIDVTGYFRPQVEIQQWREWQQALTSPQDYTASGGDPYSEVEVQVRFSNAATGVSFLQYAYWDGEEGDPRTFQVTTALPAGSWTWAIDSCTRSGGSCLAGWAPSQGAIQVQSNTTTGNPLYDRGFVQQVETLSLGQTVAISDLQFPDASKFTWIGDTAWTAPPREYDPPGGTPAQTAAWAAYLNDRRSKGFTAIQIAPALTWQPREGENWRGLPAAQGFSFRFKSAGGCSAATPIPNTPCWTPINRYWDHFVRLIGDANQAGMVVAVVGVMNPTGIPPTQPYPSTPGAIKFAKYLLARLGARAKIFSPAFDDEATAALRPLMDEVGRALREKDATGHQKPLTNHLSGSRSNCTDYFYFADQTGSNRWLTHYLFQSGHGGQGNGGLCAASGSNDVQNAMERARVMPLTLRSHSLSVPSINSEGPYDSTDYATAHPNVDTRYRMRQAGYLSALSNAVGYSYGAVGLSLWDQPGVGIPPEPSRYFGLGSSNDMTQMKAVLNDKHLVSHPEWILNNPAEQKYKMAVASNDVSFVLGYLPGDESGVGTSSATIRLSGSPLSCFVCPSDIAAPWTYRWVDPVSGNVISNNGCSSPAPGQVEFSRPAVCVNPNCDWLLRIEKTGACPAAASTASSPAAAKALSLGSRTVEAWEDSTSGGGTSAIYIAEWSPAGRQSPKIVSPSGRAFQTAPRVGRSGADRIVVWQAEGPDGSLAGVFGAVLDSHGQLTGPFQINHYTEHDQREPAVAGGPDGETLVVWSSYGQDGDRGGIYGRLLHSGGLPNSLPASYTFGEELGLAEEHAGHQQHPQVVADGDGYWVGWETLDSQGWISTLSVRRLGTDGEPQSDEIRLAAPAGEQRKLLDLEGSTADSVVVRWLDENSQQGTTRPVSQRVGLLGPLGAASAGEGEIP